MILKQWIAFKVCADWQLKLQISFAIHRRAIRVEFADENVVIFAENKSVKIIFLCYIISLF